MGSARLLTPALTVLVVAPVFGETLSGSTPPLDLVLPWNLALTAGLYGCGALLCREIARRFGFGLPGLCLLGAAYGVFEEALVDRFWFSAKFWHDTGVGSYSEIWHTNVLLAVHLTCFHAAVSICSSILVVERLFPAAQQRAWVGNRGLGTAAVVLFAVVPFLYADSAGSPGAGQLVAAAGLALALVGSAFLAGTRSRSAPTRTVSARPWLISALAFAATGAHFVLVYAVPSTGLAWPIGLVLSLAPVALGVLLLRGRVAGDRYGADAFRVVLGILGFFLLLDFFVGLGGRYDLTLGAIGIGYGLWRTGAGTRVRRDRIMDR
ncbi:MAG: hypothetical protein JWP74_3035 [Marmoricola sp.]|nr:hypothetical protein [Marmoricola sp.]